MGVPNPCRNCADRSVGCHGVCKDYSDFVIANREEKKWLKEKNDMSNSAGRLSDPPPKKGWKHRAKSRRM